MEDIILKSALYYSQNMGKPVFPCSHVNKKPLTRNGFYDATIDKTRVEQWWLRYPEALIGMPTGKTTGYTVIDIDKKTNGFETLSEIIRKNEDLPETITAITQNGGKHLYFKYTDKLKNKAGLYTGIDVRNDGGYVIIPPSKGYEWVEGQSIVQYEASEIPEWFIPKEERNKRNPTYTEDPIPSGLRNDTLIKIAGTYRHKNLSFETAFELLKKDNLRCQPPLNDNELKNILESAFKYPNIPTAIIKGLEEVPDVLDSEVEQKQYTPKEGFELKDPNSLRWDYAVSKKDKKLKTTFNNVINIISCKKDFYDCYRENKFISDIEVYTHKAWMKDFRVGKVLEDNDLLDFKDKLREYHLEPTIACISEAISSYARNYPYHPVKDYLKSLKWDGEKRVETWLIRYCNAVDNKYTRHVGAMTLVAACARIDKPGCKYDHMLILEGKQGIKKSLVVRALGGQWAGEVNIVDRDRDTVDKMRGKWIIEVPELICFKKQDSESLKAFISTEVDIVRLAYAMKKKEFPRQSIFIGTFNPEQYPQGYFQDISGNRRFFPVEVDNIDAVGVSKDRDQLFAEAWDMYKKGFKLYIDDKEIEKLAKEHQEKREVYDEMSIEVKTWVTKRNVEFLSGVEIFTGAFMKQKGDYDAKNQRRIGSIMKKLGWIKKQKWIEGSPEWVYFNPNYIEEKIGGDW